MKPFENHNAKALNLVKKFANEIFSYLDADPTKTEFNHITTIPSSQRNENNGFANFRFDVCEMNGHIAHYNVRIETGSINGFLSIESSKRVRYVGADLLIFPGEKNSIYLSRYDRYGLRDWLIAKEFSRMEQVEWEPGVVKTYNIYDLKNLLANGRIFEIVHAEYAEDKIVIITSNDFLMPQTMEINNSRMWKHYYDYNLDLSHIRNVQYDGKQAKTIYWCTSDSQTTSRIGTTTKIALYFESISTLNAKAIYQRLIRAYNKTLETGKAYSTSIPLELNALTQFSQIANSNGEITIYVSDNENFNVVKNALEKNVTADMKAYQQEYGNKYRKVVAWLKKHPGDINYPKKWDEECLKIVKEYGAKHQNTSSHP